MRDLIPLRPLCGQHQTKERDRISCFEKEGAGVGLGEKLMPRERTEVSTRFRIQRGREFGRLDSRIDDTSWTFVHFANTVVLVFNCSVTCSTAICRCLVHLDASWSSPWPVTCVSVCLSLCLSLSSMNVNCLHVPFQRPFVLVHHISTVPRAHVTSVCSTFRKQSQKQKHNVAVAMSSR